MYKLIEQKNFEDSIWFRLVLFISVFICTDVFFLFNEGFIKQIPLLFIIAIIIIYFRYGFSFKSLNLPAFSFLILALFAVPGLVVNKLNNMPSSYFTAIFQMLLIFSIYQIPKEHITIGKPLKILQSFQILALLFVISRIIGFLLGEYKFLVHETAFLLPFVILPPLLKKQWLVFFISFVLCIILVILNPRTTMFAVIFISLAIPAVIEIMNRLSRKKIIVSLVFIVILFIIYFPEIFSFIAWLDDYFKSSFGKDSNANFRVTLIIKAITEFIASPIYGNAFSGITGYYVDFAGGMEVPLHNDFLDFLTKGGIIGFLLFCFGLFGILVRSVQNSSILKKKGDSDLYKLNFILIIVVICAILVFTVNPVLNTTKAGFLVFVFISLLFLIDRTLQSDRLRNQGLYGK